jgi:hypothetical protein
MGGFNSWRAGEVSAFDPTLGSPAALPARAGTPIFDFEACFDEGTNFQEGKVTKLVVALRGNGWPENSVSGHPSLCINLWLSVEPQAGLAPRLVPRGTNHDSQALRCRRHDRPERGAHVRLKLARAERAVVNPDFINRPLKK